MNQKMSAKTVFTLLAAGLFILSEVTKNPRERIILSRDSKIANALATIFTVA